MHCEFNWFTNDVIISGSLDNICKMENKFLAPATALGFDLILNYAGKFRFNINDTSFTNLYEGLFAERSNRRIVFALASYLANSEFLVTE